MTIFAELVYQMNNDFVVQPRFRGYDLRDACNSDIEILYGENMEEFLLKMFYTCRSIIERHAQSQLPSGF